MKKIPNLILRLIIRKQIVIENEIEQGFEYHKANKKSLLYRRPFQAN